MITYDRSAFGYTLIFRAHGSAVYRSVLPSLIAVGIYFLYREFNKDSVGWGEEDVLHPYAIGVLVSTATFLIVFKLNQAYNRYWEACGNVHQFMSKWMDATTHTSCYHMQCDHYKKIKPPVFFDYPQLNSLFMTRDRERLRAHSVEAETSNSTGLRNRKKSAAASQVSEVPELPSRRLFSQYNNNNNSNSISVSDRSIGSIKDPSSLASSEFGRSGSSGSSKKKKQEKMAEYMARSVSKSINKPQPCGPKKSKQRKQTETAAAAKARRESLMNENNINNQSIMSLYKVGSNSLGGYDGSDRESDDIYETAVFHQFGSEPIPLVGKPRLDGNWGEYYTQKPKQPLGTFLDPHHPDALDPKGFASIRGGRTPPLFLQELAHLSSLMNAVALATLRNDVEGLESPLSIYQPGEPWPEVDISNNEFMKKEGCARFIATAKDFLGIGLTDEQRSKRNAALPLPVIGGVSDAEIRLLQMARGPYAKTQLCFNWLSEFIVREHLAGSLGAVGPPIISRIFQFLGDGMIYYNHARKIMFIPFPFGHAQLSVIFALMMVIVVPFLMHQYTDEPLVGALLTFLTVLCLEGINEVARDLENPFRNFPNELPLVHFQAQYNEALLTMYAGYHPDFYWEGDKALEAAKSSGTLSDRGSARQKYNGGESLLGTVGSEDSISVPGVPSTESSTNVSTTSSCNNTNDVAELKKQLEYQAKLIEELYAKMEASSSSSSIRVDPTKRS